MPERTDAIDLGFSVADADRPSLSLDGRALTLRFVDWQERPVVVEFDDTIAVRWQSAEYLIDENERFDSAHLVHGSAWLAAHERELELEPGHRHVKLNFNALGVLEVICTAIRRVG
jgi:hypothetical protein